MPFNNNKKIVTLIAHSAAWLCFFTLPYLVFFPRLRDFSMSNHQLAAIICNNVFLVLFYYLNTLLLIPRFLVKEKWFLYILSIIVCLVVFLYAPKQIALLIAEPEPFNPNNREFIRNPAFKGKPRFTGYMRRQRPVADPYNTVLFLLIFTVGTCISVIQRWLQTEQNRKETENEKLNTELSFLKSQVNPHFFFNTLNNIYSLAVVRSEKTAPAVMKLSSIMRYILTETQRDLVPLQNEVDFTNNFIDLQKVRLTDKVTLDFSTEGSVDNLLVAPLLFIPFVENAFKYGVSTKEASTISIKIRTEGNTIHFSAVNYIVPSENNLTENTGIGINNVKRRLELMYPGKHKLSSFEKDNYYHVYLEIETQ
ncbi:MAG: sensor histidine kinase [Chitinophagaceae bacterium]|nr:sensor histidine kinase [Chitinophagaceae bacterium]MCA6454615.1 sensor histidine kinase [Chitinophagaceae bacterium]MCA6459340.1 sensor histidine kinase [Chitinophagaceae bacterium]MCA6464856.1 sensor histidine kinase [Chitinophagaceae bacterium]